MKSTAESLALLPEQERKKILDGYNDAQIEALIEDWTFWARPSQLAPKSDWQVWLVLAGRGFGKTRMGSEQVHQWVKEGAKRIALVAQTPAEARDVMVEGESGIIATAKKGNVPDYEPSKRRLTWPSGAIATIYSGENPDVLRGPQHEKAWIDELAKYRYPQETWDNLMMGLRLGENPQVIVTTTPRNIKIIKELSQNKRTVITRGSTFENKSNLPDAFLSHILGKYENTRLGRQELYAEILEDNPNALWTRNTIDKGRLTSVPDLVRIVVGVDPSVTADGDEAGIVTAGIDKAGEFYVLEDNSIQASPDTWAKAAVSAYARYKADRIIGEANNGGDMIEILLRTINKNIPYKKVHASKGKTTRAEPIAALYEQGKVHHVGYFSQLEDEMCEWQQGMDSPNRMDALVWAITELMNNKGGWGWKK